MPSWLLVEPDYISLRIMKPGGDLGSVYAQRLHDLAPDSDDPCQRIGYIVNHYIKQKAELLRRPPSQDPRAAYFADGVVKGDAAIAALAYLPAEDLLIKLCRAGNVGCRHLDVTDFAVGTRGRHRHPLLIASL